MQVATHCEDEQTAACSSVLDVDLELTKATQSSSSDDSKDDSGITDVSIYIYILINC